MKRILTSLTIALILCYAGVASAKPETPTQFLKSKESTLQTLLKDTKGNQGKIVKSVTSMMDFDVICQKSLGKHWKGRSPAEQADFKTTLQGVIEKNLTSRIKENASRTPEYKSEKIAENNKEATVVTLVKTSDDPKAEKTEIVYQLERRGTTWIAVDMETDGVSLVANYRSQFNKIINEQGWDELVKKLKAKLKE